MESTDLVYPIGCDSKHYSIKEEGSDADKGGPIRKGPIRKGRSYPLMWVFIDMVRPCGDREEMGLEGVTNGTRGGISLQITLNDGKNIKVVSSHWEGVSSSPWQNNGDLQMEQKKSQKNTDSRSNSRW